MENENKHSNAQDSKILIAKKLISRMKDELMNLERLLTSEADPADVEELLRQSSSAEGEVFFSSNEGRVVEGVFSGQHMVGADGRQYSIPPNYASKSKLVEGDMLKLNIQPNGSFMYKQIGPIERQRLVGVLTKDEITDEWHVVALGKKYSILAPAVSYFKGEPGDEAVILIPQSTPSKWAALENVIKMVD